MAVTQRIEDRGAHAGVLIFLVTVEDAVSNIQDTKESDLLCDQIFPKRENTLLEI